MNIQNKVYTLIAAAFCLVAVSTPTHAWRGYGGGSGVAFGAHGGSAVWSGGSGVAHGADGGSAAWSHGTGVATGPNGGSAAWRGGSGYAHGAYGGGAVWSGGYGYRPPVYYGNTGYSGGAVAAAGVAGLAVGAMAGAAAASSYAAPPTTVVIQQPMGTAPIPLGASLSYLPGGCVNVNTSSGQYYQCGTNWFRPYFGNNGAYYQVVPAPY